MRPPVGLRALCLRLLPLIMAALVLAPAAAGENARVSELLQAGMLSEALSEADNFLSRNPRDAHMRFLKGLILAQQNRTAEAITLFAGLARDFPRSPEPYNNLAVLYAATGQYEKARAALETALRIDPAYATARRNLADIDERLARKESGEPPEQPATPPVIASPVLDWGMEPSKPAPLSTMPASSRSRTGRATGYRVRSGDSLGAIARRLKHDGVSLDQMLVALYRANPAAFVDGNLHRLRAGQLLAMPDAGAARSIGPAEAKAVVSAHTRDFREYRHQLADRSARLPGHKAAETLRREAGGKIEFDIEERQPATNHSADRLKLSAPHVNADAVGAAISDDAEDLIAMEKALEDAKARVRQLEKNIAALQKLMQIKSTIRAQSESEADMRLAVKAGAVVENRQPQTTSAVAGPAEPTPSADPMHTYALWLALCGVLLTGLAALAFLGGRTAVPGVRSAMSALDRRQHRYDRRHHRDRLSG